MPDLEVGVLGARSLVGACVLSRLTEDEGGRVIAFSRRMEIAVSGNSIDWRQILEQASGAVSEPRSIEQWICVAPIWVLSDYFQMLESYGVRKVVAVSSTSLFSKNTSDDLEERLLAKRLADAEAQLQSWAESHGVEWVILRPTLIYGLGQDKNIAEIARFIRRFGFFPLFGKAQGLRQPIRAEDVAAACVCALQTASVVNRAYDISGGETLPYRDMILRIFATLGRRPRMLNVPLWAFRLAVALVHLIPRYRHWSGAMAERMNRDLVFDHTDAACAFSFNPSGFALSARDLP